MELQDPTSLLLLFGQRRDGNQTNFLRALRTSSSSSSAHCLSKLNLLLMLSELVTDEALVASSDSLISIMNITRNDRQLSSLMLLLSLIDVLLPNCTTLGVDVVCYSNELLSSSLPLKRFVDFDHHPVAVIDSVDCGGAGDARFRSMFCSFALRHSSTRVTSSSLSSLCECVVCFPPPTVVNSNCSLCETTLPPPAEVLRGAAMSCQRQGFDGLRRLGQQHQGADGRRVSPLRSRRVNVANLFLLSLSLVLISLSEWFVLHCYHRKEFRRKGC